MNARRIALVALQRIDKGAYANLVLPGLLAQRQLSTRERGFATELVYGTTRMRRACDWLIDRYLNRPVEPEVRAALRLGAYQLAFLATPPHAAVSATVAETPMRARGLVNAVLRKVAAAGEPAWPDIATRLSYPDWVVERLTDDLGADDAVAALEQMNVPGAVNVRPDGYVQDAASQLVVAVADVRAHERVADVCAAPGGKATGMAAAATAYVVAGDVQEQRSRLVRANVKRLGLTNVGTIVADGRQPPLRPRSFNRVLVDAPCSGLGVLRRRPDARWRIVPEDIPRLAILQRQLVEAAIELVRPGGMLIYSVCTLTGEETVAIDEWLARVHPELVIPAPPPAPWTPQGRGARLLPQAAGTDGMYLLRLQKPSR